MADFICGYPPIVTISGSATTWAITWAKGEWDTVLFNTFTNSDYVGNITQADTPLIIASVGGEQADGTFDITITGDASSWVSGTDRCIPKVGSTLSPYTTVPTCIAAMNGTTDRMLLCYSTTGNRTTWQTTSVAIDNSANSYSVSGILPDRLITVRCGHIGYGYTGDCTNAVAATLDNFTMIGNSTSNSINGITIAAAATNLTGILTCNRLHIIGFGAGVQSWDAHDVVVCNSCIFEKGFFYTVAVITGRVALYNCTHKDSEFYGGNLANTLTNNVFINCNFNATANQVITTCKDTTGTIGDLLSLSGMGTMNTESTTGRPDDYSPASGSALLAAGTNNSATHDIHGQLYVNGSYPIGASLQFDYVGASVDPGVGNVLTGVGYTITGTALTGTFDEAARNTDPGVGNVLVGNDYTIQNVAKTATFDEAARNVDPGIANVKLSTAYTIQNSALVGTYDPLSNAPTAANLAVVDAEDGATATATISGGDAGATYTVYTVRGNTRDWTNSGSRTGNGDVTLTLAKGDYIAVVIGGVAAMSVGQASYFWISAGSVFRTRTRNRVASKLLASISGNGAANAKGIQITFSPPGEASVVVWAMDVDFRQITILRQSVTDTLSGKLIIPRQTGFPPTEFKVGTTITHNGVNYGVDEIDGNILLAPAFTLTLGRFGDTELY